MHEFSNIKEMAIFMSNVIGLSLSSVSEQKKTLDHAASHRSYTVRILIDTISYTVHRLQRSSFIACIACSANGIVYKKHMNMNQRLRNSTYIMNTKFPTRRNNSKTKTTKFTLELPAQHNRRPLGRIHFTLKLVHRTWIVVALRELKQLASTTLPISVSISTHVNPGWGGRGHCPHCLWQLIIKVH